MTYRLSLDRIAEAARVIDPVFLATPQYVSEPLSEALGVRLVTKVETLNPVRCFKGRGADYFAATLPAGGMVVVASSGNLGQALAYTCRRRGVTLIVFAGTRTSPLKLARMSALGAEVRLAGEDFDAAKAEGRRFAHEHDLPFVEDGVEPRLSEGAGSIAVELLTFPERLDAVLVSLGNGAILGGMACWISAREPGIEVIGVAPAGAPCMAESFRLGRPVETGSIATIADGMGTRVPVPEALDDLRGTVSDVVLVEDETMIRAMRLAHRHLGLVLEPSGAAGIAALLAYPERFQRRTVAVVLCGGNLAPQQMAAWLGSAA
ncbi:MAG TPA: pyridoxal-phosphate dependent enzyme [Acetobacteraceae bacterium]|nr:pyridoxal-phosphate dependent enzyme [Acetobacteraceae bacterium]